MILRHKHITQRLFFPVCSAAILLTCPFAHSQRAEDIKFAPEKIPTIPGHGMTKAEYPFDHTGYYRTDWVSTWIISPVSSSVTLRHPISPNSKEHSNYKINQRLAEQERLRKQLFSAKEDLQKARPISPPPVKAQPVPAGPSLNMTQTPNAPTYGPRAANAGQQIAIISEAEAKRQGYIGPYAKMQAARRRLPSIPSFQSLTKMLPGNQPSVVRAALPATSSTAVAPQVVRAKAMPTILSTPPPAESFHRVDQGDTLFNISQRYGMSVESLKQANGLKSNLIKIGQNLRVTRNG